MTAVFSRKKAAENGSFADPFSAATSRKTNTAANLRTAFSKNLLKSPLLNDLNVKNTKFFTINFLL